MLYNTLWNKPLLWLTQSALIWQVGKAWCLPGKSANTECLNAILYFLILTNTSCTCHCQHIVVSDRNFWYLIKHRRLGIPNPSSKLFSIQIKDKIDASIRIFTRLSKELRWVQYLSVDKFCICKLDKDLSNQLLYNKWSLQKVSN